MVGSLLLLVESSILTSESVVKLEGCSTLNITSESHSYLTYTARPSVDSSRPVSCTFRGTRPNATQGRGGRPACEPLRSTRYTSRYEWANSGPLLRATSHWAQILSESAADGDRYFFEPPDKDAPYFAAWSRRWRDGDIRSGEREGWQRSCAFASSQRHVMHSQTGFSGRR